MKNFRFLIVMALCASLLISCKNNKAVQRAEQAAANQEVIDATMPILADQVLATLDSLANLYLENGTEPIHKMLQFTEEELLVKPTYLLEPSQTKDLLYFAQKSYAFAELVTQLPIRQKYNLPTDESKEAIARIAAELNLYVDSFQEDTQKPFSERLKDSYEWYKEHNRPNDFWTIANAFLNATAYLATQNIEMFVRSVPYDMCDKMQKRVYYSGKAILTLSKYDKNLAKMIEFYNEVDPYTQEYFESDTYIDPRYTYGVEGLRQYLTDVKENVEKVRAKILNFK